MRGYAPPTPCYGDNVKIQKGTYKIITAEGWRTREGSVGYEYPFYIFREEEHTGTHDWCISHMASGYSIRKNLSLKQARQIAEALKRFPLFLLPDADSIAKEKARMPNHQLIMIQNILNLKEKP